MNTSEIRPRSRSEMRTAQSLEIKGPGRSRDGSCGSRLADDSRVRTIRPNVPSERMSNCISATTLEPKSTFLLVRTFTTRSNRWQTDLCYWASKDPSPIGPSCLCKTVLPPIRRPKSRKVCGHTCRFRSIRIGMHFLREPFVVTLEQRSFIQPFALQGSLVVRGLSQPTCARPREVVRRSRATTGRFLLSSVDQKARLARLL